MDCKNCGKNLDEDSSFCEHCGYRLSGRHDQTRGVLPPYIKIILAVLVIFILTFSLVAIGAYADFNLGISEDGQSEEQSTTSRIEQKITELQSSQASTSQIVANLQQQNNSLKEENQRLQQTLSQTQSTVQQNNQQNQGLSEQLRKEISSHIVRLECVGDQGVNTGSGIIDTNGQNSSSWKVYTNFHVVYAGDNSGACRVGIPESPDYKPDETTVANFSRAAEDYPDVDFAILETENAPKIMSPFPVPECNVADVETGDQITVFGYPSIGGESLTVTSGIVSGRSYTSHGPYYKTSAKIGRGVSGGIAIDDNSECSIGIPTLSIRGELEGLGYIQSWDMVRSTISF